VKHYPSVLLNGFFRAPINNFLLPTAEPVLEQILRVNMTDPSFELLPKAAFVVYYKKRGLPLLGANARNEYMFMTPEAFDDASMYAPETNELYFSLNFCQTYSRKA
jgi:hypothetical protein